MRQAKQHLQNTLKRGNTGEPACRQVGPAGPAKTNPKAKIFLIATYNVDLTLVSPIFSYFRSLIKCR
ncbi:MAG: hypothetical protein C0408_08360 [Odoribacter sp.]|nr:hypothetical protein [Odoribacter sp.]